MKIIRITARIIAGVALLALGSAASLPAADTLRYATVGEPPSLDQQVVTSDLATTIAHHIFEGLYTFDASYEPRPLLASGEEVAKDGKSITVHLRKDVKFHDGQAMTSADVVASLKRWGEHGSRGKLLFSNVAEVSGIGRAQRQIDIQDTVRPVEESAGLHQRRACDLSGQGRFQSRQEAHRRQGLYRHRSVPVRRMETEPSISSW